VERSKKLNGKIGVATLATHQFYNAKARPALAGTPILQLNENYFKERTFSSIILINLINSSSLFPVVARLSAI
jgi:hypothetical protein